MTVMRERLEKLKKNKDGFTLVELIVVLVILAILIGMLVPSLTGYINKAHEKAALLECRQVVLAAQVEASSEYGKGNTSVTFDLTEIKEMAEVPGTVDTVTAVDGKVTYVRYISKRGIVVIYENGEYRIEGKTSGESGDDSGETGGGEEDSGESPDGDEGSADSGDSSSGGYEFEVGDVTFVVLGDAEELYQTSKKNGNGEPGILLASGVYKVGNSYYYNWGAYYSGGTNSLDGGGALKIDINKGIQSFGSLSGTANRGTVYEYKGKYYVALYGAGSWETPSNASQSWSEITPK